MYICLLRCEGEFYSPCLPKVPVTQWMPKACLFNEHPLCARPFREARRIILTHRVKMEIRRGSILSQ